MTPEQIDLVKQSFEKVVPIAPQAADLFYDRLFEIAPEVVPLFKGDMPTQGAKLMQALGLVVGSLDRLHEVLPAVKALAVRHVGYGVKEVHYTPVGAALLWTLEQGLGDQFTPAVKDAWIIAYGALSGVMIAAAYREVVEA
ncbi:hemin receptor [Oleomonas cavernae]|uniref:Hemin receptor n=1 Tax=Oleomonas cavernae TaxID=2320859 RepID=A0A418WIF1_9PROT|nr:globin family protein [Oleomonas cavernae]RJF89814.1 hemin receptor [Oleomonas cavernae]